MIPFFVLTPKKSNKGGEHNRLVDIYPKEKAGGGK